MTRRPGFALLLACFAFSGVAGLIYESAWTQQLALVFGTSELAVATVLAAYMAGLTAGAAIAARRLERVRRPVLLYALLELGVALAALAVPVALRGAARLHVALLGGLDMPAESGSLASAIFYLVAAFGVLAVPTGMMGATLPLLTRHAVRTDAEIGRRVGSLYAANTAGAAAGALVAAFVLLPGLGLGRTVLVAAAINGLIFVLAALLARGGDVEPEPGDGSATAVLGSREPRGTREDAAPAGGGGILPLILISGVVSFTWEVLWTRLLSYLVGSSIYGFGTMLATFLVGIGLGSAGAARLAVDRERAWRGFAWAQLGVATASYLAFAAVDRIPRAIADLDLGSVGHMPPGALVAAALLLPGTVFMGAAFPFAVRILAGSAADAGPASARVFAWNTCGAIAGAVGAGFVLLPGLRFAGTAAAAMVTSLALAAAAALLVRPRRVRLALAAALGLAAAAVLPPATPWQVLRASPLPAVKARGEVAFYGVGRSSTVILFEDYDGWSLSTNGLPEATIPLRGTRPARGWGPRFMALLPLVGQPQARSYLVVGLGAGLTVEAVPAAVDEVHVVELEEEVVRANRRVAGERDRDPLADPRVRLHLNDARSALALAQRRFDAIVSQPSHPWTAGAAHLFTREFFELARSRLRPGGVFVQWMGPGFVDEGLLRSLVATLLDVFPNVEAYQPKQSGPLFFLAGVEPLEIEATAAPALAAGGEGWREIGIRTPEDVILSRRLDTDGARAFAAGAPLITDARNLLQTRSPTLLGTTLHVLNTQRLFAPFDPLARPGTGVGRPLYYVRKSMRLQGRGRAAGIAAAIADPARRQAALGLLQLAAGRRAEGEKRLRAVLDVPSASSEAFSALLLLHRPELARSNFPAWSVERLATDPEARAVVEAWRLAALRDPARVRQLEPQLAALDPRHPLAAAATNLRLGWRQALGEPRLAREALALLEPELAGGLYGARGLLLRARLGVLAEDRSVALGSLAELATELAAHPKPAVARAALRFLETFPTDWENGRYLTLQTALAELAATRPQTTRRRE